MDKIGPVVSIVLPTFNGERYLRQAVESCLGQSYRNIELIIVDDCSVDRTPEIIKSYTDPRIVVIRNRRNKGLPRSLNIGFSKASGDYLTWTSDDNEYKVTAIAEMLQFLQSAPAVDFVCADLTEYYEGSNEERYRSIPDELDLRESNMVGACFLYTRKLQQKIGQFDDRYSLVEDYDYWLRISKSFTMRHLPVNLYYYRYHSGALTSRKLLSVLVMDAILKYCHGFLSRTTRQDKLYDLFSRVWSENGSLSGRIALIAELLGRIRRVSPALAADVTYDIARRWLLNKSKKLVSCVL